MRESVPNLSLFLLLYSDLIDNKFDQFPEVQPALPVTVLGERSLPVLIQAHEPFLIFFPPCPA